MQTNTSSTSYNPQINQLLHEIAEEDNKSADEIMIESLRCYLEIVKRKKLQQQIKNASLSVSKQNIRSDEWGDFFKKTAGCLQETPLEREAQGDYEQRFELL